jgi:hypothetical protein
MKIVLHASAENPNRSIFASIASLTLFSGHGIRFASMKRYSVEFHNHPTRSKINESSKISFHFLPRFQATEAGKLRKLLAVYSATRG